MIKPKTDVQEEEREEGMKEASVRRNRRESRKGGHDHDNDGRIKGTKNKAN